MEISIYLCTLKSITIITLKNEECIKIFFAIDAIVCSRCSHQG